MWYDMGVQKGFNWLSEVSEESHGKEMVLRCFLKDEWKLVKLIWKKGKYNRKKTSVAGEFIYTLLSTNKIKTKIKRAKGNRGIRLEIESREDHTGPWDFKECWSKCACG